MGSDRNIAAKRSKAPAGRAEGSAILGSDPNLAFVTPTADNLSQRYLQHVRVEKRLAPRTVELYSLDLQKLTEFAAKAHVDLLRVQTTHIRQWVARMHAGGRSPRGIALVLSGWRGFYAWAGRESLVTSNPVVDVRAPKAAKPLPKALSVDDAVRLASFGRESANPWLEARDVAMVELLYGSGLRVAELTGLDVAASKDARGWIDLAAAEAHVLGKGSKRRIAPLGKKSVEALQVWLDLRGQGFKVAGRVPEGELAEIQAPADAPRAAVGRSVATSAATSNATSTNLATDAPSASIRAAEFGLPDLAALFIGRNGTRLTSQSIWQRLRTRSLQAGLPTPVHPHMLRHSFASHLLQSSSDLRAVQELLGHANISTTQVYTRLDFQHLAKTYDAAHPRAKLKR